MFPVISSLSRMHRLLHITLVSLLLLTLQSTPMWAHRHESLSPQELAVHLLQYHAGTPAPLIPQGWHVHRSAVQLIDPALERRAETNLASEGLDSPDQLLTNCQHSSAGEATHADAHARFDSERFASLPLFRIYQSLLI